MRIKFFFFLAILSSQYLLSQEKALKSFLTDSSMKHAAVSLYIIDIKSGNVVDEYNSLVSLIPASVFKLFVTSAALELLGPEYTFKTEIGYNGILNKRTGILRGNVIIRGGGDPTLGSEEFRDHYADFADNWILEISKAGIRKVKGKVITDDSYYDFQPVPGRWLWEDAGNYYGAGVYGLSIYNNTYEIHFNTASDSSDHIITGILPKECGTRLTDRLIAYGTDDEGYVFAAPYSTNGWLEGTIPADQEDFILKASIPDPPMLMAEIIDKKLRNAGIKISGKPATARIESDTGEGFTGISVITSPPLKEIIKVLNHESVNLYAEHLVKELGKVFRNEGSTAAGTDVVKDFLKGAGIETDGIFMEDGSGLSPSDGVNAKALTDLLVFMKNDCSYPTEFFNSLPEAGIEGTLKNYFKDPAFESRLSAKSGSMTRVRSYAGYIRTMSNKDLAFCIIVNNFTGPSSNIVYHIEEILKEIILNE